jgi:hypothetical protein
MERGAICYRPGLLGVGEEASAYVPERQLLFEREVRDRGVMALPRTAPDPDEERERLEGRIQFHHL